MSQRNEQRPWPSTMEVKCPGYRRPSTMEAKCPGCKAFHHGGKMPWVPGCMPLPLTLPRASSMVPPQALGGVTEFTLLDL